MTIEVDAFDDGDDRAAGGSEEPLSDREATAFRAIAARINFLSIDRPDLQICSKEASRCMARPTVGAWDTVKRIGRYLLRRGRVARLHRCDK